MKARMGMMVGLAAAMLAGTPVAFGETFKDGETVCFLGDSITARGSTQTVISDYYLTRFPERTVRFANAGRSGDSAGGALGRLQEDVSDKKPTAVAIMFGMNDVGRGNYVAEPSEKQLAQQKQARNYIKQWSQRGELLKKVEACEQESFAVRKPVSHVFVVAPVAASTK